MYVLVVLQDYLLLDSWTFVLLGTKYFVGSGTRLYIYRFKILNQTLRI